MSRIIALLVYCTFIFHVQDVQSKINTVPSSNTQETEESIDCVCGIFLSGSFKTGRKYPPKANVTLIHEPSFKVPCTPAGKKLCTRQCLNVVLKHVNKSSELICGALARDCYREKAYLFVKNCNDKWMNTNLSGARQYCCKDGHPYKCSVH